MIIMEYQSLFKESDLVGEMNDCTVKATAVALGTTYADAHNLLKEFGREDFKGCRTEQVVLPALISRGFIIKKLNISERTTVRNFEKSSLVRNSKNPLLVRVRGHLICIKDGKNEDDISRGSRRIVKDVFEVIPTENSVYSEKSGDVVLSSMRKTRISKINYVLRHKETKQVYIRYKRKPRKFTKDIQEFWIVGKKEETFGKLELIKL